jgi:hypothetical protein
MLEKLNVIVAERMDFVTHLIEKNQMSDECRNHIFPPKVAEPRFQQLSMYTLSGVFTLLMCLSVVAFATFLIEILIGKCCKSTEVNIKDSDVTVKDKSALQILDELVNNLQADNHVLLIQHYDVLRGILINCDVSVNDNVPSF